MAIAFHTESTDYCWPTEATLALIRQWIIDTATAENNNVGDINIIACSDDYLLDINRTHLAHDYYTDIITFPYADEPISGDLFISVDRTKDNAETYEVSAGHELGRVIIHGVLHLLGYGDKTAEEADKMRQREDRYLQRLASEVIEALSY